MSLWWIAGGALGMAAIGIFLIEGPEMKTLKLLLAGLWVDHTPRSWKSDRFIAWYNQALREWNPH